MKKEKSLRYFAKELGVSPSYLCQVKNGQRPPSKALLNSLHKVLSNERLNLSKLKRANLT